jgi:hypothetical protein
MTAADVAELSIAGEIGDGAFPQGYSSSPPLYPPWDIRMIPQY